MSQNELKQYGPGSYDIRVISSCEINYDKILPDRHCDMFSEFQVKMPFFSLFKKMFSGKKSGNKKSSNKFSSGNSNKTDDTENPEGRFWFTILIAIAVIIIIWALSGIFTVQQYEQGVILRFGKNY